MMDRIKWIYILDEDFEFASGLPFADETDCFDRDGKLRLSVYPDGLIRIYKGYAWDGCSPKWNIWDIALGTPDGVPHHTTKKPKTYRASLIHDALYQFLEVGLKLRQGGMLDRKMADKIFLRVLTMDGFRPAFTYYRSVRMFGCFFVHLRKRVRKYSGSKMIVQKGIQQ